MAALDGAIAFVEMERAAFRVGDDLDFDVFRAADVAFEKNGGIAEGGGRFVAGFEQFGLEFGGRVDDAHAAATTAEGCLDDQREADAGGDFGDVWGRWIDGFLGAGDNGYAGGLSKFTSSGFVAKRFKYLGARAYEGDAGELAGTRECGVLREKTVARMDGIDFLLHREFNDAVDIEICLDRAFALSDEIGFIGFEAMQTEAVFLGVNSDGAKAELVGGAQNADRDFTTIESEQFSHGDGKEGKG